MRALRSGWAFRAGRRSRRLAGGVPRGDGVGKTGGGIRALAVTRSAAATVAVAALELRNARNAPWLGGPRGDGSGKTGGDVRALVATRSAAADVELRNACIAPWLGIPRGAAAATVAAAALELRNARIAPWTDVTRGATVATVRGRRPARRRLGETGSGLRALAVTKSAVETVASAQPESCLTLRGRIPLHCAARGRGKME
ncbi:hypothetical protein KTD33_00845 [Burkholderia gladioli]|uniref:hypothetical protein n=1 Tax=Burkholderia gladioli TaxID=28095 RepID=UPI001C224C67|nr:hypothetical protein [Burkholderia gladioli]MBU9193074.1 hypothetical protein [Burkholderia gladioli]